ncbi:3015_t:CDS:2, partial [Cetraspora pellucida]
KSEHELSGIIQHSVLISPARFKFANSFLGAERSAHPICRPRVQTLILSIFYYLATKIKQKNDTTPLEYVEPAKRLTDEPPKHVETNNRDYDLGKLQELLKQTIIGIIFMMILHLWFEFTQPLFIQSILPLKTTYENPIVQIHLLGKPAEGDLKRPFKTTGLFGNLAESQQPQTDKAAIKKAKKQ